MRNRLQYANLIRRTSLKLNTHRSQSSLSLRSKPEKPKRKPERPPEKKVEKKKGLCLIHSPALFLFTKADQQLLPGENLFA